MRKNIFILIILDMVNYEAILSKNFKIFLLHQLLTNIIWLKSNIFNIAHNKITSITEKTNKFNSITMNFTVFM